MKEVIGKYIFELFVIFIGITASFLFEEWRQNQQKDEKTKEIMKSMIIELERNNEYILEIDTSYLDIDSAIQRLITGEKATTAIVGNSNLEMEMAEISYDLMEEIPKFRLKNIASFIHGFSSADQLDILNRNKNILQYLSYLESLLDEHESYTNAIGEYATLNLWPLVYDYGLSNYIISNDENEFNALEKSLTSKPRKDINNIRSDHGCIMHLKWSQLKIRRLIAINQFIHKHINNAIRELNNTIEDA